MPGINLRDAGDGIRILSIDNASKKNALNNALCMELSGKVRELADDKQARVAIVTGEGGAFCAGADLPDVFGTMGDDVNDIRDHLGDVVYQSFLGLRDLKIPVISAVEGPAVGAGLNMALAADVVIASPTADFAATFSKIGLHQGGGCTPLLVEALGRQRAMKLLLEGGRLTGQEAYDLGLVAALADDPMDAALELAKTTAGLDPRLSRNIKTAVKLSVESGFDAALQFETWAQAYTATQPGIQKMIERLSKRSK
ncbi:enoyl-CoA hydratase-related protein [Cumulibacter manganitolerans]|uniref:enoyl-CoA hydratase-related protein n=1 Tax=Cumulibacter manganitolerans TaxID=1884992 RepID=UPI001297B3DD|nr:enoyl-CoA hydratase-related protein [Cumulibacter manganitolerans]